MGKGILHLFRLAGFALILIVLLALFHLLTIGIPGPLTRNITGWLQKNGIPLQIDSISLSTHRGWVLHNVRIYSTEPDDLRPVFQTEKLYVHIWPEDWTPLSLTQWDLTVYSKQIEVSLGLPWENSLDKTHPFRTINRLQTHLKIDPSGFKVDTAEIDWGGYTLRANGQAAFPDQKQQANPAFYSALQTRATQAAELLSELTFSTPPEINLHFNLPADGPEQTTLDATFIAGGLRRQERLYDRITGAMHLCDNKVQLDSLQIALQNNEQLSLSGRYNLSSGTAQLDVTNSLQIVDLLSLLPESAAAGIAQSGLQPFGAVEFDASLGPCPPKQLLEQARVQMHNLQITREDLTIDPLRFDLVRTGNRLEVKNIQAQANGGLLTGNVEMDVDSGAWHVSAQGSAPTAPVGTLLGGGAQNWINRVNFTNRFPDITADVSWGGKKGSLLMRATLSGQDVLCAGIPLETLDLTMAYSNRTFALTSLQAARGDQSFSGTVAIDFARKLAFFDVDNEFAPAVIAQFIAPNYPTILTHFTFTGPLTSTASGQIDYSGGTNHAVQGSLQATTVSAAGFTADSFQGQIEARGDRLIFSDTSLNIFNGIVEGSAVFDLQFNDETSPYRLDLSATRLNLNQLAQHLGTNDHSRARGQLSTTLDITADAATGFWASAEGQGEVEIQNGQLHDLPVLGGFSRLIRTTLPGFSFFSMTTLYSEYELHDGALRTDNLQFGGTLLSARGHGSFSPEKDLDFVLKAEPLRQTRENKEWYQLHLWGADILKQGTAPLFSLLEFKLTGTLDDPYWRLTNLPKEISFLLQGPTNQPKAPQPEK